MFEFEQTFDFFFEFPLWIVVETATVDENGRLSLDLGERFEPLLTHQGESRQLPVMTDADCADRCCESAESGRSHQITTPDEMLEVIWRVVRTGVTRVMLDPDPSTLVGTQMEIREFSRVVSRIATAWNQ